MAAEEEAAAEEDAPEAEAGKYSLGIAIHKQSATKVMVDQRDGLLVKVAEVFVSHLVQFG